VTVPAALAAAVARATGAAVTGGARASGGSINDAWALELAGGRRAFVKTRADAAPGEYATEAAGLRWLAAAGAVELPEVLAVGDDGGPRFLALEWIEEGRLDAAGEEALGRGLAALHAAGAPAFGAPPPGAPAADGAVAPLRIGELALPNDPARAWPEFYARRRLEPLVRLASQRGALSAAGSAAVTRVCERIGELSGPPEPPARLHGDLWGGNVLAGADGRARLIDPAAYGGHREVDLAMLRLFGAPSSRVFAAYEEVAPLADGHTERVALWQLFPLLVHAALFGGHYGESAERAARRYAG
jgi:fructosamine-3-kinase